MDVKKKEYSAELRATLERANSGDAGALPALSAAFDEHPELVELFGDLAKHAEISLLNLASRTCLTAREAISRQLKQLRDRLNATAGTELERLLVTRLSLDWLSLHHAQLDLATHLEQSGTSKATQAAQQRLDRAHARFLAACKTLANVGRLLRRAPSPLELLGVRGDAQVPQSADRATRRFNAPAAVN